MIRRDDIEALDSVGRAASESIHLADLIERLGKRAKVSADLLASLMEKKMLVDRRLVELRRKQK